MENKQKKILVVDDEPDILEFLQVIMEEEGLLTVACLDRLCYTIPIFLRKKESAYDDIC